MSHLAVLVEVVHVGGVTKSRRKTVKRRTIEEYCMAARGENYKQILYKPYFININEYSTAYLQFVVDT